MVSLFDQPQQGSPQKDRPVKPLGFPWTAASHERQDEQALDVVPDI